MIGETKRCPGCERELPAEAFGHEGDALRSWCRACDRAQAAKRGRVFGPTLVGRAKNVFSNMRGSTIRRAERAARRAA